MTLYSMINRSLLQQGQIEDISQVVSNLDAIATVLNGNIDTTNFGPGQIFLPSKFMQEGAADGQVMAWSTAGGKWGPSAARPIVTYGTTPPASPVDGDEWVFPYDATAGIMWRFRYRSASASAYKWEFVGGTWAYARVATQNGTNSGAVVDLATPGPQVTVPRSGEWTIQWGAHVVSNQASNNANVGVHVARDGVVQFSVYNSLFAVAATGHIAAPSAMWQSAQANSGQVWKLMYNISNGSNVLIQDRWLAVQPVRVS